MNETYKTISSILLENGFQVFLKEDSVEVFCMALLIEKEADKIRELLKPIPVTVSYDNNQELIFVRAKK